MAFVSFSPGARGGADKSLLLLLGGLVARGLSPLLVVPSPGELQDEARKIGVRVEVLDLCHFPRGRLVGFVRGLLQLRRLCRRCRVDLIHCNAWTALQWALPVAASLRIPVVCHYRETAFGRNTFLSSLLVRRSHTVVAVSSAVKNLLIRGGVREERVTVIHNAVDLSLYDSYRPQTSPPGGQSRSAIIGMASRLMPWKGHRLFLQAAAEVVRTMPDVEFRIAGEAGPDDGAYGLELHDGVRRLGLEGYVRFLGYQKDIAPFMQALDLLVLPSENEPFGRVLIEAMAAAKPVVAFEGGGVAEIVDHEVNGLLVPAGDVAGLAGAMRRLITDRSLAQSMGRAGRAKVERCFTVGTHVSRILEVYSRVMKG